MAASPGSETPVTLPRGLSPFTARVLVALLAATALLMLVTFVYELAYDNLLGRRWLAILARPAVACLAVAASWLIVRARRSAAFLALLGACFLLISTETTGGFQAALSVVQAMAWVAVALVLLVRLRRSTGATGTAVPAWRRDLLVGAGVTLVAFLALEGLSGAVIRLHYRHLRYVNLPDLQPQRDLEPGLPVVAAIGSSPFNSEILTNRNAADRLAERFEGRLNVLSYRRGGLSSQYLARIVESLAAGEHPPEALLLYMGHQDLNAGLGSAFLRDLDPLEGSSAALWLARTAVEQSSFVRLQLYLLWRARYDHIDTRDDRYVDGIFAGFQSNVGRILKVAGDHGMHVFAVTVQMHRDNVSPQSVRHSSQTNGFMRDLPERYPFVTLVDFEAVLDRAYPDGPLPDCEPFEPNPYGAGCGDPFHLGPQGHEILADTLQPYLEDWLRSRGAAAAGEG